MQTKTIQPDWAKYAQQYDMLLSYNPFYQKLHEQVLGFTQDWDILAGDVIIDLGGGTGNYSTAMAKKFPQAKVIHIDRDEGMNRVTQTKKELEALDNLTILAMSADQMKFQENSIKACTCIHAFYTFPKPQEVMQELYRFLVPGGYGIFVDPGRIVNVLSWQLAIGSKMIKSYGIKKTLQIMKEGKEVSKQNKLISLQQKDGTYWTHSHEEFLQTVKEAGFSIISHGLTFRKLSDWVVVKKQ